MKATMQFIELWQTDLALWDDLFIFQPPPLPQPTVSCIQKKERLQDSNHGSWHFDQVSHPKLNWAPVGLGLGLGGVKKRRRDEVGNDDLLQDFFAFALAGV